MKSLEALKELDEHCITWHDNPTKEKIKIIEKELKALEIIKEAAKYGHVFFIDDDCISDYYGENTWNTSLEKINLLKEVFSND